MITYIIVQTYILVGMFLMGFSTRGLKDADEFSSLEKFALPIITAGLWPVGIAWVFAIEPIIERLRGKS